MWILIPVFFPAPQWLQMSNAPTPSMNNPIDVIFTGTAQLQGQTQQLWQPQKSQKLKKIISGGSDALVL